MAKHGAISDTLERARHYGLLAHRELALFPAGEARDALAAVVDFSIERTH